MKEALAEGLNVRTRYTITDGNFEKTQDCYNFVSNLGVKSFMCKPVNIAGSSITNNMASCTPEQVRKLQLDLMNQSIGNQTRLDLPSPLYIREEEVKTMANTKLYHCMCGKNLIYIAYNGDVYPCTYLAGAQNSKDFVIGNIKDESFDFEGTWNNPRTYEEFRNEEKHICTANRLLESMAICR